MLVRNVVLLTGIIGEVIQLNAVDPALFELGNPGLLEVVQLSVLLLQLIGFGIGEVPVEHAGAKIHSAQLFLKIIAEDFFDLLHEAIGGFNVDW